MDNEKDKTIPASNEENIHPVRNTWSDLIHMPVPFVNQNQVVIPVVRDWTTFYITQPMPTKMDTSKDQNKQASASKNNTQRYGRSKAAEDDLIIFVNNCKKLGISVNDVKEDGASKSKDEEVCDKDTEKVVTSKNASTSEDQDKNISESFGTREDCEDDLLEAFMNSCRKWGYSVKKDEKDGASKSKDEGVGCEKAECKDKMESIPEEDDNDS